jgi:hypothetical protein
MGTMIQAQCKCGYSSDIIFQGGGFETFMEKDMEPAYCEKCQRLIVLNYKESNPRCSQCLGEVKFYSDSSLQKKPGKKIKENHISSRDFLLPKINYLCPQCGKIKMKFYYVGDWD